MYFVHTLHTIFDLKVMAPVRTMAPTKKGGYILVQIWISKFDIHSIRVTRNFVHGSGYLVRVTRNFVHGSGYLARVTQNLVHRSGHSKNLVHSFLNKYPGTIKKLRFVPEDFTKKGGIGF